MKSFLPHQVLAARYTSKNRDAIALFMHMRLGKTLLTIRWANSVTRGDILVVCPISTMKSWVDELRDEKIEPLVLRHRINSHITDALEDKSVFTRWCITNPEKVRTCTKILEHDWELVILDESTCIKNPKALITKVLRRKCMAPRRAILTGMPAPEGLDNYVEQFIFLDGEFMNCDTYYKWRHKYMENTGFKYEVKRWYVDKILKAVASRAFTMTVEEAGIKMPIIYAQRHLPMPPEVRRIYNQVCEEYRCGETETKWTLTMKSWLAMLTSGIVPLEYEGAHKYYHKFKIDELIRIMNSELIGQKVVVFCRYTREIAMTKRELIHAGISVVTMTGATTLRERIAKMRAFQERDTPQVIVAQSRKVGEKGLDLSRATAEIFISNNWSGECRAQCEMRACHPTKKTPVLIMDIITENTIDESVVEALKMKHDSESHTTRRIIEIARKRGYL